MTKTRPPAITGGSIGAAAMATAQRTGDGGSSRNAGGPATTAGKVGRADGGGGCRNVGSPGATGGIVGIGVCCAITPTASISTRMIRVRNLQDMVVPTVCTPYNSVIRSAVSVPVRVLSQ